MEHKHGVYDSDTRFSINPATRQIKADPKHRQSPQPILFHQQSPAGTVHDMCQHDLTSQEDMFPFRPVCIPNQPPA